MSKHQYLFLLGGPDLEMQAIQQLLKKREIPCADAGLSWKNASIEAYDTEEPDAKIIAALEAGATIVGVEIKGTPKAWPDYLLIDHHNENEDKPSSIEQVAVLLGLSLNRDQQLIAANDRGYIPAMRAMGATEEEIQDIRKRDRRAQGVTEEDERLGRQSVEENLTKHNGVAVVKSLTSKFSTVTDLLSEHESILVYTKTELTYYGQWRPLILANAEELDPDGLAYFGGGKQGYWGVGEEKLKAEEIEELRDKVVALMEQEWAREMKSYHVFMFPFKWEHADHANNQKDHPSMSDRFDLDRLSSLICGQFGGLKWKNQPFSMSTDTYNEYNYFYPHVREILYDLDVTLSTKNNKSNRELIRHFKYALPGQKLLHYCIKISGAIYYLQIDSVLLNVYSTGVGVLSLHLRNFRHKAESDVLKINQFGRRLFPPFFGLDNEWVSTGELSQLDSENILDHPKQTELPDAVWLGKADSTEEKALLGSLENFKAYEHEDNIENGPFQLPKFFQALFDPGFFSTHLKKIKKAKIYLRPVVDDRMFVLCWFGGKRQIEAIKQFDDDLYAYESSAWWHKFMFLDVGAPMCQNRHMRRDLNRNHTYARWIDWGTLYGLTRYSLMMLTTPLASKANDGEGVPAYLVGHLQTMYYKMAELCLIQRATVLSYADEVTHVSDLTRVKEGQNHALILKRIEELYSHYILFVNKIYFQEVTAQEQGIEMYNQIQKHMNLKADVKDLDQEIEELHNYAKMVAERKSNYLLTNLTIIGAFFLPLALMATMMSWPSFPESFFEMQLTRLPAYPFWSRVGLMLLASTGFTLAVDWLVKLRYGRKRIGKWLYGLGFASGFFLLLMRFLFS